MCKKLNVPSLGAHGLNEDHVADVVAKTAVASSTKGNPIVLTAEELTEILRAAM